VTRRRVLAFALALAALTAGSALGLAPGASAEPCDDSVLECGYADQDQTLLIPVQTRSVATMIPLRSDGAARARRAFALYRRLIPAPYTAPAFPAIGVQITQIDVPSESLGGPGAAPGVPATRWLEAVIALKVRNGPEEGWFPLALPVDSAFALDLARDAGLPAVAGTLSLNELDDVKTLDAVTGRAAVGASRTLSIEWSEHPYGLAANFEDWVRNRDPLFTRTPALTGPAAMRVKYTPKPYLPVFDLTGGAPNPVLQQPPATGLGRLRAGLVHYRLDATIDDLDRTLPDVFPRGTSLATLIKPSGTGNGAYLESSHLLLRQVATLG
jgi:hypothetical protein